MIKVGDFVFCLGDGMDIFQVISVDEKSRTAFLSPAVNGIGTGGNENIDSLSIVEEDVDDWYRLR